MSAKTQSGSPCKVCEMTERYVSYPHNCHYTNLQPLWAADNLVKSDKQEAA